MIARTLEIAIVSRAFLIAVGQADRTVHIKNDLLGRSTLVNSVYPYTGQIHQEGKIRRLS